MELHKNGLPYCYYLSWYLDSWEFDGISFRVLRYPLPYPRKPLHLPYASKSPTLNQTYNNQTCKQGLTHWGVSPWCKKTHEPSVFLVCGISYQGMPHSLVLSNHGGVSIQLLDQTKNNVLHHLVRCRSFTTCVELETSLPCVAINASSPILLRS